MVEIQNKPTARKQASERAPPHRGHPKKDDNVVRFSHTCEGGVNDPQEEAERGKGAIRRLLVVVIGSRRSPGEHGKEDQHRLRHDDYHSEEESHGQRRSELAHHEGPPHGERDQKKDLSRQRGKEQLEVCQGGILLSALCSRAKHTYT